MLLDKINALRQNTHQPAVLVIGDLMVDHYIWGDATRLSPEAPVPVVSAKRESINLGGAANVARNLVALGARVTLSGLIGNDAQGGQLVDILNNEQIDTCGIVTDESRPTTVKTRVLAGNHQLVRVDKEVTTPVSTDLQQQLAQTLENCLQQTDMVLLSDYNKGFFAPALTQQIIRRAKELNKKVIVDPKGLDYTKYKGAYIIKPNRKELADAAKSERITTIDELRQAARVIFDQTGAEYLIITLSEEGIAILDELTYKLMPVKATEVFDVTGAGDTAVATIAYFLARGLNIEEACELANHAAAIVIRHVGAATTTVDEIIGHIKNHS